MIQRIQSLYLLGALILLLVCFFLPVAEISTPTGQLFVFNLSGFKLIQGESMQKIENTTPLFIAGLLICFILLVTIFLYKNRIMQIRLSVYGIVLSLGLSFLFFFVLHSIKNAMNANIYYYILTVFPIISGLLCYLAMRAIKKDENLVKSYDRLR